MLNKYLKDLLNTSKTGDATEVSYYPDLKKLIEGWGEKKKRKFLVTPS